MPRARNLPTLNINIEIKDLPEETNKILNILAKMTGNAKTVVIRSALIEYGNNHKAEIMSFITDMQKAALEVEEP